MNARERSRRVFDEPLLVPGRVTFATTRDLLAVAFAPRKIDLGFASVARRFVSAFASVALACAGSSQTNEPKRAETPVASSARPTESVPLVATESDPALLAGTPRRRARFAASPISEFSEKIVELVTALLDGRPLPNDLPLATLKPGRAPIGFVGIDPDEARRIDWWGVGPEIDFSVTTTYGKPVNIRGVFVVTEAGLHLVAVDVDNHERKQKVPDWARGLETVANDLLATAKRGELATLLHGEELRRLIGDEELWEKAGGSLPKADDLAEVEAVARAATSGPTGFRLDDIAVVGRAPSGKLCECKLEFDEQDGRVVVNPQMTVRAMKRESAAGP